MASGDRRWLWGLTALFAVLYIALFPQIYTSIDEADTFSMAYVLRHGRLFPWGVYDVPSLNPAGLHGSIYRFPIGFPAVLTLLTFVGWRAFFLLNPLLHLAATWAFSRLLAAQRVSPRWAALYLFYPPFVLFARTLFSDLFAASLTTLALYFLLQRRTTWAAGLCLGLAVLSRSASAFIVAALLIDLILDDWRSREKTAWWRGRSLPFLLGLLPFVLFQFLYSAAVTGNPVASTYAVNSLTLAGLHQSGPVFVLSLLLIFPGLLLAPWLYRGTYWKAGLAATTSVVLLAAAYNQSTYGNSFAQTLISTPRQVLPALPFFLLAYISVLARWSQRLPLRVPRGLVWSLAAGPLFGLAALVSLLHQGYLRSLLSLRDEISQTLPAGAVVYANKDAFKLHQPVWDRQVYRELPYVSEAQARADLARGPVYAVLYMRSRGFRPEDDDNALIRRNLLSYFRLSPGPMSRSGLLWYYRIQAAQTSPPGPKGATAGQ